MTAQWKLYIDDEQIPHFIMTERGEDRIPTVEECERAIRMLNEEGSNIVRISCQNKACPAVGGWIERTRKDVDKHVYKCDVCERPMQR